MTAFAAVDTSTTADTRVPTFSGYCAAHDMRVMPPMLWPTRIARRPAGTVASSTASKIPSQHRDRRPGASPLAAAVSALVVDDDPAVSASAVIRWLICGYQYAVLQVQPWTMMKMSPVGSSSSAP